MIALPAAVTNTERCSQEVLDWPLSPFPSPKQAQEVGLGLGSSLAPVYRVWELHNRLYEILHHVL